MRISKIIQRILLGAILIGALAQCGKKTKSSEIAVTFVPKQPIVFPADTKDTSGNSIRAPWFSFKISLSNPTDTDLIVIGVLVTVSATDTNGQTSTVGPTGFSSTNFDYTISTGGTSIQCTYTNFVTVPKGAKDMVLSLSNTSPCNTGDAEFFIANNPGGTKFNGYHYSVQVELVGWFGSVNSPEDRFQRSGYLFTQ